MPLSNQPKALAAKFRKTLAAWRRFRERRRRCVDIEWARAAWQRLKPFSSGGTCFDFLTEDEGTDRVRAAYGVHHQQRTDLTARWDPDNLFRCNKNMPPRGKATP